ncbi:aldo/keto reductase [Patulibacter defluvii]|uniref:aldo/keto reductase n=1 Tax=Patulibacter defluvii TaxID=3095358 RepID=UPI002A74FEAF|nr:aldo/keto reductase [Patulibacter sp. DM4]
MPRIGTSDLDVFPLNLGGNVFGWTADERQSHQVLDAFADAGGNFVDTADSYSAWVPGHEGGESERIIGSWLRGRRREDVVIATKVSQHPARLGLGHDNVIAAAEDSLRRLGTDHIDLYYAHFDDAETPLEETLRAFDQLVRDGKVRWIAGSNYSAERLSEALAIQQREGLAPWVALQPHYNLVERAEFEGAKREIAERERLGVLPYWALAKGFLTGKYRDPAAPGDSPRAASALEYLDDRGRGVLAALDAVAAEHDSSVTAVAIAWLAAQPTVVAPIASARTVEQLQPLLEGARLRLDDAQLARLDAASAPVAR